MQNGAGQFEVAVPPASGTTFCDGKPHEILVVKDKSKVTVTVDSLPSKSASKTGSISVDTPDTAYFGGIPGKLFMLRLVAPSSKLIFSWLLISIAVRPITLLFVSL